jgi:hypothetical protein
MENDKVPYICGPLTELPLEMQGWVRPFYSRIADVCEQEIGKRPFVPHEHYDPIVHAKFLPREVYEKEVHQIREKTSILIVAAVAPSWGGGIEAGIAGLDNIPIILLRPIGKAVSRLLLGIPSIICQIVYDSQENALSVLKNMLRSEFAKQLSPQEA